MVLNNLKTVIFDMDGLLVDTETIYTQGWKAGVKKTGTDVPNSIYSMMTGRNSKQNMDLLYEYIHDRDIVREIRKVRVEYFLSRLDDGKIDLMPYAQELLDRLKESDYKLVLATSSRTEYATKILAHHQLTDYFEQRIYGDTVKQVKPAPDIYLRALKLSNSKPEESLILEDSLTGAKAGENANVDVILIPDKDTTDLSKVTNERIIHIHDTLGDTFKYFFD